MKVFGLIVAIILWLMSAFGCAPATAGFLLDALLARN